MQLQQLMYFVTVADQGSFNKAAGLLFISQPNLSKAIANLEAELDLRLFERHNTGVTLTESGKKLYDYSSTIMNQLELIQRLHEEDVRRTLHIASYPIAIMSELVAAFYNRHQTDNLILSLHECRLQKVLDLVEQGHAEIGFTLSNNVQHNELKNTLRYKNLEAVHLGLDTWYINVGPNHPLYDRQEVNIRELLEYPVVRLQDDYFSNLTYYLAIDGIRLDAFKRVVYVSDSTAIQNFLLNTNVFRFCPGLSRDYYARMGIHTIPIHNCNVKIDALWIRRRKEILSKEAQEFIGLLETLYPRKKP